MSARVAEPAADPRRHVVQFYERDDELAGSVGDDFGQALRARLPARRAACAARLAGRSLARAGR